MRRTIKGHEQCLTFCLGLGLAVCLLAAGTAHAQLAEGGNIPWEDEWTALAPLIGAAASADLDADQVPDAWEYALAETIVSQPGIAGHQASNAALFNTTLTALQGENPAMAAAYGHFCALAILRGRFSDVNSASTALNGVGLTSALYTSLPAVTGAGDPDGDGVTNQQESARDSANYVAEATTPATSYRLGMPADLLDAAFYASGLKAWEGTLNNAGTTVAFFAVNSKLQTAIYLVDLGNSSSWRPLTDFLPNATPSTAISWTPDDSALLAANVRIPLNSGAFIPVSLFGYQPNDPSVTALPANNWMVIHGRTPAVVNDAAACQGGDLSYEFSTDGNMEGWTPQNSMSALTVAGGRMQGTITGPDPYIVANPTPFPAAANPYVIIRMKSSYGGTFSFFWWNDADSNPHARTMTLGPRNQFNTYLLSAADLGSAWTGNITIVRVDPSDGLDSGGFELDYVRFCLGSDYTGGGRNLIALPINMDGTADSSRAPVVVTNFLPGSFPGGLNIDWPNVSPDGNRITFAAYSQSNTPGVADSGDIYAIDNVNAILAAPKIAGTDISSLAPTEVSNPHVVPVRAGGVPDNFAESPSITQNNQLVLYEEDFNNIFRNVDFFGSLALCDLDVLVSRADGNGRDFRLVMSGNQFAPTLSRGGTRVLYASTINDPMDFHLFMANLESETPVVGTVLPGNDLLTSVKQTTSDTSGTQIALPAGLTVDFPESAPQAIQIVTPIEPVREVQLPPGAGIDAIPVVREFGPTGTTFSTPIEVTVSYTDAEVAGLDEANIKIFLYNDLTGVFDIPVTTIVRRDTAANTIIFTVDHFSKYGLGAALDTDGDGLVDAVDPDDDNDGIPDAQDTQPLDTDNDGVNNVNDSDDDSDGIPDALDALPLDTDNDGVRNDMDADDDGDGISDTVDPHPFDTDNDGLRNDVDADDDNDGIPDVMEGYADSDGDGLTNNLDLDSDGDGVSDFVEYSLGTNPYDTLHPTKVPVAAWPAGLALAASGAVLLRRKRR